MPNENNEQLENEQLNNENQQQENQQQNNEREIGTGNIPDNVDKMLDSFIDKASHAPTKATEDKTKKGQENNQQQQQPNNGQQQAKPGEQSSKQDQQNQQVPAAARKFGNTFFSDAQGSIYTASGQRIAAPGAGHQLFRKLYPYIEKAETELAGYRSRVENYERATQAAKDAGLSLDEQSASLSLMVAYKKDPKQAINFLLQQAQARGIDTSDIVQGSSGLNEATLRNTVEGIIAEALKPFAPFIQQSEQQQQQQELMQEAQQQYTEFMQNKPDAKLHSGAIASVMDSMNCDMQTAYFELKTDALQRGLDWTKPLAPQYQALRDRAGNQNQQPNGGRRNQNLPDFTGRSNSGNNVEHGSRAVADAGDSWDSIISGAVDSVVGQQRN